MAKPQRTTLFKTGLEDRPGAGLAIAKELKGANVALVGLWGYTRQSGQAEAYLIPKNPEKLRKVWSASGRMFSEETGLFLKGTDKTGALVKSLDAIAQAGINVRAVLAVAVGGKYGTFIWVAPADLEKAATALGAK